MMQGAGDEYVVVSEGVTCIGSCAFSGYTGLSSVVIPDNVTNIGEYAFKDVPHII